jgi:release factor glutamine methyltransferase
MPDPDSVHFFLYQGVLLRVPNEELLPKFGGLLLARALPLHAGDRVLEVGTGSGLVAICAARQGHPVVATDIAPTAVACARANGLLNGVGERLDVRHGDLFAPVTGETFNLIACNPPQMPTPVDRIWDDLPALINDGGRDGWAILDRVIRAAPAFLRPGGRLVVTLFDFLGLARGIEALHVVGLAPRVLVREAQRFPRIARERLAHIRSLDHEGALPPGKPAICGRIVLCGERT